MNCSTSRDNQTVWTRYETWQVPKLVPKKILLLHHLPSKVEKMPETQAAGVSIFDLPALPPPKGVKSNFSNPHSLELSLKVNICIWLTLMVICVAVRLYTRTFISKQKVGWDDGEISFEPKRVMLTSRLSAGFCILASVCKESSCFDVRYPDVFPD